MKKFTFLFFTIFLFSTIAYSQSKVCRFEGTIEGWDTNRCRCCGGWIIKIDKNIFLADSIPRGQGIFAPNEKRKYPIKIYLDFTKKPGPCNSRIIITCIEKR